MCGGGGCASDEATCGAAVFFKNRTSTGNLVRYNGEDGGQQLVTIVHCNCVSYHRQWPARTRRRTYVPMS